MDPKLKILFCVSLVYFLSFGSLYIQLPGIIGDNGVSPVRLLDLSMPRDMDDFLNGIPTVVRFKDFVKLSSYQCTEALVVIGLLVSLIAILFSTFRNTSSFIILWICHFSVSKVCSSTEHWPWCKVLNEVGFLCIPLALKFKNRLIQPSSNIVFFMMKWLLFRITISNGVCKLSQYNSAWWDLNAFEYLLSSQMMPTPLAWYAKIFPQWTLRLVCAVILMLETITPMLFWVPLRGVQLFSFYSQLLLHIGTMLACNISYYNVLMIALCYSLLPRFGSNKGVSNTRKWMSFVVSLSVIGVTVFIFTNIFGLTLYGNTIKCSIAVQFKEMKKLLESLVIGSIFCVGGLFAVTILFSIYSSITARGHLKRLLSLLSICFATFIGVSIFIGTMVPFTSLHASHNLIHLPKFVHGMANSLQYLNLANDYRSLYQKNENLFVHPSSTGRRTLVLEGAMNEYGPWKELNLIHSPGPLNRMPAIIPAYSPAIDFELATAAHKTYSTSPLVANIVYRILTNEKDVMSLIELTGYAAGPKYIQIKSYDYQFTHLKTEPHWWTRTLKSVYLPPTHVKSTQLAKMVQQFGLVGKRVERHPDPTYLSFALEQLRLLVGNQRSLLPFYTVILVVMAFNRMLI